MAEKLVTKNDLLNKLRAYNNTPDDENILYKKKIEKALLSNPCLLYALNEKTLESELFDDDGNINSAVVGKGKKPANVRYIGTATIEVEGETWRIAVVTADAEEVKKPEKN